MSAMLRTTALTLLVTGPVFAETGSDQALQEVAALLRNYDKSMEDSLGSWPGFDPAQIPKIVLARDRNRETSHLLVLDHPNAEAFGKVTPLTDTVGETGRAFLVKNPEPSPALEAVENFDFALPLGGAPTFVIVSHCDAPEIEQDCATNPDFTAYLLHEVFHRWQDHHFLPRHDVDQSAYDYSRDAIAAVLLEMAVLHAAVSTQDARERMDLARQFVAVRRDRAARFRHVALDNQQERYEGTARYIEHRIGRTLGTQFDESTFAESLQDSIDIGFVNDEVGFGRFYATGAAILQLAMLLGVEDAREQITKGAAPTEVLAKVALVDGQAHAMLIANARKRFDPQGVLSAKAARFAQSALDEPDIFE